VLALSDYGGMTIEAVAARAGVNKTTVYRKWPNKAVLIQAALNSVFESHRLGATSGNLRDDLRRIGRNIRTFVLSLEGRSLMRLHLLQHPEPELAGIAKDLHDRNLADLKAMMDAAVARRELGRHVDVMLLLDMFWGALHARLVMRDEPVDDALLRRIVELLMVAGQPRRARRLA
jgi:AcrR family transcriptional regulator